MMKRNSQTATRESFPGIKSLPEQRATLRIERVFTEKEYELICQGVIPESMDDKWFIFLENDVLYFHRSWTGFCIYQVSLEKDGAQYKVVEALANRDSEQFSGTDEHWDIELLTYLIDGFLLRKSPIFRKPPDS